MATLINDIVYQRVESEKVKKWKSGKVKK